MATVKYNGSAIVPAPLYSISNNITRATNGAILSYVYVITLKGTLLPNKGSPNSAGSFGAGNADEVLASDALKTASIITKQAAIRSLFFDEPKVASGTSKWFEIESNGVYLKCEAMTSDVSFDAEINVVKNDYTIIITTNNLLINGKSLSSQDVLAGEYNLKSASDNISTSAQNDYEESYTINRTISAQSYKTVGTELSSREEPWKSAQDWVKRVVGSTDSIASFSTYPLYAPKTGYEFLNKQIQENINKLEGSYSVSINWNYVKTSLSQVIDEWTSSYSSDARDGSALNGGYNKVYKVSGSIRPIIQASGGYALSKTRWNSVKDSLKNRALSTGGVYDSFADTTHVYGPYNLGISENRRTGVINYDAEFKEKNIVLHEDFSDIDVQITVNTKENSIVEIPIIGRAAGPVIQNLFTTNTKKTSISASFALSTNAVRTSPSQLRASAKDVLVGAGIQPTGAAASGTNSYFVTSFSDSVDVFNGRYTYNITYVSPGEVGPP